MPDLWPKRFKSNVTKLSSGDIYQGAEVVRDLSLMARRKGISDAEQTLLEKARELLISELSIILDSTEQSATDMVDAVLAEPLAPIATFRDRLITPPNAKAKMRGTRDRRRRGDPAVPSRRPDEVHATTRE